MTVEEIYTGTIKPLPAGDRLRLATLILNDIPPQALVDSSEEWSEEDLPDFNRATWEHINSSLGEQDDGEPR